MLILFIKSESFANFIKLLYKIISIVWMLIGLMSIHPCEEYSPIGWKKSSFCSTFINEMKFYQEDENWLIWQKIINGMKIRHLDGNASVWWKFITGMKIYHCDENSSLWWKFITVTKIYRSDENDSLRWKIITVMKINECEESWWIR